MWVRRNTPANCAQEFEEVMSTTAGSLNPQAGRLCQEEARGLARFDATPELLLSRDETCR